MLFHSWQRLGRVKILIQLRPELHQPHVPLGFCFAKHAQPTTRGQHYTLSVRKRSHPQDQSFRILQRTDIHSVYYTPFIIQCSNTIVGRVKMIAMVLNDCRPLHSFMRWPLGFLISLTPISFSHLTILSTDYQPVVDFKKKIMKLYGRSYKILTSSKDEGFLASGGWCIAESRTFIITRRACHDANIAPWLLLANRLRLEASFDEDPISQVSILSRCAGWRWRVGQMIPPVMSWSSGRTS